MPPGLYYSVENGAGKHSIGRALSGDIMASDVESSTSLSSAGDLSLTCSLSEKYNYGSPLLIADYHNYISPIRIIGRGLYTLYSSYTVDYIQ